MAPPEAPERVTLTVWVCPECRAVSIPPFAGWHGDGCSEPDYEDVPFVLASENVPRSLAVELAEAADGFLKRPEGEAQFLSPEQRQERADTQMRLVAAVHQAREAGLLGE
jgi:hypothetical protein